MALEDLKQTAQNAHGNTDSLQPCEREPHIQTVTWHQLTDHKKLPIKALEIHHGSRKKSREASQIICAKLSTRVFQA